MEILNQGTIWFYLLIIGLVLAVAFLALVWIALNRRKRRTPVDEKTQPSRTVVQSKFDDLAGEMALEFGIHFIQESGAVATFVSLPVSIGKNTQNDLVLNHETISAHHARVYFDDRVGAVCIQDLDSANGIWIDNHPTNKNVLQDGIKIWLGEVRLEYRDTGYIPPGPI